MVLRTVFHTAQGRVALTDALALESGARGHDIGMRVPHVLLRRAEVSEGEVELEIEFSPRLEYGLTTPLISKTDTGVSARGGPIELHLVIDHPLEIDGFKATARLTLRAGDALDFALVYRRAFGYENGVIPDLKVEKNWRTPVRGGGPGRRCTAATRGRMWIRSGAAPSCFRR
jgi:hypothetical protein